MIRNSRSGSSSVFLCVILSALVSVCFAFIYSTLQYTAASRADAMMHLTANSLLSEFDKDVLEEYGLFLLPGNDRDLSRKLNSYLTYTFGPEPQISVTDPRVSSGGFSTADLSAIREQILAYAGYGGAGSAAAADPSDDQPVLQETDAGRALRHGPTIASLPSRQLPTQDFLSRIEELAGQLTDVTDIFRDGSEQYMLSGYVLNAFNCTVSAPAPQHFFQREVEYILNGELTDQKNLQKTASALRCLRLPLNFAHLYADEGKRNALAAAAEAITPGPAASLTQAALATAWAYAESVNDAELLVKGFRVPLLKDDSSWAVDLENIIEEYTGNPAGPEQASGRVIHPKEDKGLSYGQYLRILLSLEDRDILTARILDLIQINMRKNVNGSFLISEYCSGISLEAVFNGRRYAYETLYQRLLYH
ncbi:MAG: hypothetical protein IJ109_08080 [Firmicutes bacterium]|nr:hypothetical protein [Bacillota bacterium]